MATSVVLAVVLLQVISLSGRIYGILDDLGVIENEATELGGRYSTLLKTASGYESLLEHYNRRQKYMTLKQVDGLEAARKMAADIGKLLQRKVDALNASVEFAERLAENYQWNPTLQGDDVPWVNSKKVNDSGLDYTYSEKFKQRVSYYNSSVHIPVEIYEGDIKILNGLAWTHRLEEQWQQNIDNDPALLWQYFGSQTGIFRKYPSTKWQGKGVDLYDVRRRPWYTQGASSPKDMLILVDTSGSTHGQALTLMKQSVRSLIDTLGENDFVNVARFSDEAGIVGCFQTFVQANHINKEILYKSIDTMEAKGMASYSLGLEFAFEQFKLFAAKDKEGEGAHCNRIIMFLTDGGTEIPEDVIRKHNWPEKKIRIFGYAVGPTANPVAAVKWIACSNKGYFARIPAMGAIRSTVQEYYRKMGYGLAHAESQDTSWSKSYNDVGGLGMMTTVTLPVYNRTEDIKYSSNQTILGVMGCDVTVDEMLAFTPTKMLGASGYVMAINANGYVMFHPNLKAQNGWLDDPPNVDFLDVEQDTPDKRALRRDMIDGKESKKTLIGWGLSRDEMHLDNMTRTYSFTPVPGTNFSLAIVLEGDLSYYLESADATNGTDDVDNTTRERFLSSDYTAILLAPWDFCKEVVQMYNGSAPSEDMLYRIINPNSDCDQELIDHLLFDALVTEKVEVVWKSLLTSGIDARFLSTAGGLTRVYPISANTSFLNALDPKTSQYFQRAMNTDRWTFFANYHQGGLPDPNATEPVVTAVRSITLSGVEKFKPAVAGVRIEQGHLRERMVTTINACDKSDVLCYLLDDSGYLILSSDEEDAFKVGQFFGDVDPILMHFLINTTVYMKNEKYDFQAACPIEKPIVSAGPRSFIVPVVMDMLTLNWWTSKFAWMYVQFNIYEWLTSPFNYNHAEASSMGGGEDAPEGNRSCIRMMTQYYFNEDPNMRAYKDDAICGNCSREFATARLQNTNLLLVAVDLDCDGICDKPQLNSVPVEKALFEDNPETCEMESRYRVRPAQCYDYDERENDGVCGAASGLLPSVALMAILQMISLCLLLRGTPTC